MCGIAGIAVREGRAPEETLRRMAAALAHRGPDDMGFHVAGPVLAHLRPRRTGFHPAGTSDPQGAGPTGTESLFAVSAEEVLGRAS